MNLYTYVKTSDLFKAFNDFNFHYARYQTIHQVKLIYSLCYIAQFYL